MFEKHFTAHGLEKLVDYQVGVKKRTLFILEEIVIQCVSFKAWETCLLLCGNNFVQ